MKRSSLSSFAAVLRLTPTERRVNVPAQVLRFLPPGTACVVRLWLPHEYMEFTSRVSKDRRVTVPSEVAKHFDAHGFGLLEFRTA